MGVCGDATAVAEKVSREQLDEYAAASYAKAVDAQVAGRFAEEIILVEVPQRRGPAIVVDQDEEPSKGEPSKLAKLRPAFQPDGLTTAGNASSIDDGACALVMCSRSEADRLGRRPLGTLVAYSTHAQDPKWFTTAPAFAIQKLLSKAGLDVSDIDLFEVNEVFAVVAMVVATKVGIPSDRLGT